MTLLAVALGGALGAALRYLVVSAALRLLGPGFPWGTMIVNVAGSLAMGLAFAWAVERSGAPAAAPFLLAGVLGGFTTFSAFSLDAVALVEQGRFAAAALYAGGSTALSLLALAAGLGLARALA